MKYLPEVVAAICGATALFYIFQVAKADPVVTVRWEPPTAYEDDTPLPVEEIRGWVARCVNGTSGEEVKYQPSDLPELDVGTSTEAPLPMPVYGEWWCSMKTVATNQQRSVWSNVKLQHSAAMSV